MVCDHSCHGITIVSLHETHCSTHRRQLVYCTLCRKERCLECHPYQPSDSPAPTTNPLRETPK